MMKCPYCGEILDFVCDEDGKPDIKHYFCPNSQCELFLENVPKNIIDDLITGKKAQDALKVAIKGIKEIESDNERGLGEGGGLYSDDTPFEELLKEIASIIAQEKE